MTTETILGLGASILTGASMLPQLVKIYREKKAADISYLMLTILITGLGLWVWYGLVKEDYLIVCSNAFAILINSNTLILNMIYFNRCVK